MLLVKYKSIVWTPILQIVDTGQMSTSKTVEYIDDHE